MESGAFLDERVQEEFGRYVGIVLHTDGSGDKYGPSSRRNKAMQRARFKTIALPLYVILDPTGEKVLWKQAGVVSADDLLEALKKAK
jgi:hypothetical protein